MWFTAQDDGYRGWFIVKDNEGNLRTGLAAGDFTVTVIEPNDGDSDNPAVSESGELSGTYYFDVPSAFLITNGDGEYNVVVEVDTFAGPSGPPNVRDVINSVLQVSINDFDNLADRVMDSRFDNAIYVSNTYGSGVAADDLGTRQNPVTWSNAPALAIAKKIRRFIFIDAAIYTLTQAFVNYLFEGENFATINMNGQTVTGSNFIRLAITGTGSPNALFECYVFNATLNTNTFRCLITLTSWVSGTCVFNQSYFYNATLSISGGDVYVYGGSGSLSLSNVTSGNHKIYDMRGSFGISVGSTGGNVSVSGSGTFYDSSNGTIVNSSGFNDIRSKIAARGSVVAGGDDEIIYTDLTTYVDGFFDNMKFVVSSNSQGIVARDITNYNQVNGEFEVDTLPFTPQEGDTILILSEMALSADDLAQAILNSNVPTGADGTLGNILGRMYAVTTTAQAGSTSTSIKTTLSQADDYFNDMQVLVNNTSGPGGPVVRNITQYNQTDGEIIVDALPFTPDVGVQVLILSQVASTASGGVWTIAEKDQVIADTAFTKEFTAGKWHIINNQMIFYKSDGSELIRFNLFNEDGTPAMEDIFKRVPV